MAEVDLIYKITILNLLSKADYPLRQSQIADFLVENGYTDYFTVQKNLTELLEADMLDRDVDDPDAFQINAEGVKTLDLLYDRITPAIEEDTRNYFATHGMSMKKDNSLTARYDGVPDGGYEVRLKLTEGKRKVMDISVHVTSKDQAEAMCLNWRVKYNNVYDLLMDELIN